MALGQAVPSITALATASGAAVNVFQTIDRTPLIDTLSDEGLKPASVEGNIVFENVHFRYQTRPDVPVLQGLSITVRAGQTVAVVGASGCGKSTIVSLLERFYDPSSGRVSLDGHDLRTVRRLCPLEATRAASG